VDDEKLKRESSNSFGPLKAERPFCFSMVLTSATAKPFPALSLETGFCGSGSVVNDGVRRRFGPIAKSGWRRHTRSIATVGPVFFFRFEGTDLQRLTDCMAV
jgi:hypothetical protein